MLVLTQADYTYILRSLDLNMNYTDGLLKEFFFDKYTAIEEFFKKLTGVVGMRIDIQFDQMAMMLLHQDKSFLSELLLNQARINTVKFMDGATHVNIEIA